MPGPAPCQVETYSGFRLHELPRRFTWTGKWLEVRRILNNWRDPEHLHFKVEAADRRVYLLSYNCHRDAWEVRLADQRPCSVSQDHD